MKIGIWGKVFAIIYAITYFPFSFSAYLSPHSLRQFNHGHTNVGHQHIHQTPKQILSTFKQNLRESKNIKSDTLYSITTVIAKKTTFQPFLTGKKVIEQSIEQFYATPGYMRVFARVIEGAVRHDTANFNGTIAELQVALCKSRENKKILEFNKIIKEKHGPLAEIDIVTEGEDGEDGKKTWCEVKVRKQLPPKDISSIKKQAKIQKTLAKCHGINEHELFIITDLNEFASPTNKIIPYSKTQIIDEKGNEIDSETEDDE